MSNHPFTTVRDLLRYAVSRFNEARLSFGQGNTNAYDEAAYLVLHTLHLPLDTLDPFLDARLLPAEMERVLSVINRRAGERVPAAYITNEAWMHGYRFYVDERVLIPRSFLGELLQDHLQPWIEQPEAVDRVLELCTGSGCLAILAAEAFPHAQIDAVDISRDALAVAGINVRDYGLGNRLTTYQGDLYAPLPAARYDVILTNPPYVNAGAMQQLPPEFLHEPRIALAGGDDGMDVVRRIIADARRWLTPDGVLIVEVGHEREHVEAVFPDLPMTWLTTSAGDDMVFLVHASDLA